MLISRNLHVKSSEVSIKTRSTPASLSFNGQATKHTTVKWSIVDTLLASSATLKSVKPRSTFQCLRSSLRCVFLVSNQFDPVKKAFSVMAASVGSTAPATRAYHSLNTETQLKPVHLSTGVA